jgi:hypothetical protein
VGAWTQIAGFGFLPAEQALGVGQPKESAPGDSEVSSTGFRQPSNPPPQTSTSPCSCNLYNIRPRFGHLKILHPSPIGHLRLLYGVGRIGDSFSEFGVRRHHDSFLIVCDCGDPYLQVLWQPHPKPGVSKARSHARITTTPSPTVTP